MSDEEYQSGLSALKEAWGSLVVDETKPGILRAVNDETTGILVGFRAKLIAEIINRALAQP